MKKSLSTESQIRRSAQALQKVAKSMLPFYRKIATNRAFAEQWTTAVTSADLTLMGKLLASIPALSGTTDYGTNGIGYFVSFPFPPPIAFYTNGTTIPPGTVQFTFSTRAHRSIACAVLPLYRKLATCWSFAKAFARGIENKDSKAISYMVREWVTTRALKTVSIEDSGVALLFKLKFSKYPYRNLLFRENP